MNDLNFELLNIPTPENIDDPTPALDDGGELKDIIVSPSNKLTPVMDLEDEEPTIDTEGLKPEDQHSIVSSVENFSEETSFKLQTGGVKKALDRLQKATGLNFDQPQPKPPPSIMIEKGVCRAYLQGACYLTVAPLIHLLCNGRNEDVFAIEIDSPYLSPSDFISLASAIEQSQAKVNVNVRRINSMYLMFMMDAADEIHVAPNVHTVGSMTGFAMGSTLDVQTTSKAFEEHEAYAHEQLLDRGFITEDELEEIREKAKMIRFTTEELLGRLKYKD